MASRLSYPKDRLYDSSTDYVEFTFYKYKPPFNRDTIFEADKRGSRENYNYNLNSFESSGLSKILLYMPEDIGAQYGVDWGAQEFTNVGRDLLNVFGAIATGNAGSAATGAIDTIKNSTGRLPSLLGQGVADLINTIPGQLGGQVDLQQVLSGLTGTILNPNTELLFNGFTLRSFDLAFKMAPTNGPEATEIKTIINTFKQAALPRYGSQGSTDIFKRIKDANVPGIPDTPNDNLEEFPNNSYISNPYLCQVNFKKGASAHPFIPKYKPCVISNIDVSYTPDGSWATYSDGSPVATSLRITFKESKLVYAEEIEDGY